MIQENTIAFNSGDGIYAQVGNGNRFVSNSIFSNTGLGIDLGADGVAGNDSGDADTGANAIQNTPVLTSAANSGGVIVVSGSLNSTPNTSFTLEFFQTATCDPSGSGEAQAALETTVVNTDGSGNVNFGVDLNLIPAGQFITATATDPSGNTSELSTCRVIPWIRRLFYFVMISKTAMHPIGHL